MPSLKSLPDACLVVYETELDVSNTADVEPSEAAELDEVPDATVHSIPHELHAVKKRDVRSLCRYMCMPVC